MMLTIGPEAAFLDKAPASVKAALTYSRGEYDRVNRRMVKTRERLYEEVDGGLAFPPGLAPLVAGKLNETKVSFNVEDRRPSLPDPDFSKVSKLRPGQDSLLLAVAGSHGGLVVGGTGIGKSFIISQICAMYPGSSVVVVSPTKSVVKSLRDRIGCKIGSDQVGLCADGKSETSRRVVVSTCASILKCDRDCDLLLFDEAHGVGHNEVALNLREFKKARKFGFTATPGGRSDGADLVMEAVFGPVLASIPYAEAEAGGLVVPIEVVTHRVDMGDSPLPGDPVSRKRWRYWRNKDRNKAVADAALSFPEDELVLVMVETLEHAAYLAPMLPGFKVAHAAEGVLKGRSKLIQAAGLELGRGALDEMRKSFARGDIKKIIATMAWKQGIDVPMLTALVRADGSASPITSEQVPGRLSRLSEGKDKGVLVDFIDEGCAWSERRTAARLAVYRKAGWTITEDKDKHGPIDF